MIIISCICATDGTNNLGIFPMPAKSHMIAHSALMKELARIGHQEIFFSHFPDKYPIQNLLMSNLNSHILSYYRNQVRKTHKFNWYLVYYNASS
jgi:hypothetical protein